MFDVVGAVLEEQGVETVDTAVALLGRQELRRWLSVQLMLSAGSARQAAKALVGADSGTTYATGDRLKLKLAEANPLTGALKFVLPDADASRIEARGTRPDDRKRGPGGPKKAGKFMVGQRGRPGNIRHQGRKK